MFFKKSLIIIFLLLLIFPITILSDSSKKLKFRYREVKQGDTLYSLFGDNWEIVSRINHVDKKHLRPGMVLKVPLDWKLAKKYPFFPKFLEVEKNIPKLILVSLVEQFLAGYEYGRLKFWYPINSGTKNHPTPCGKFKVNKKYTTYWSHDYKQPMPYALMFTRRGHAIHYGVLIGKPSSHGCIRLLREDAKSLYSWAVKGTVIWIVNSFKELK